MAHQLAEPCPVDGPVCSTSTFVAVPSTSIAGRNDADRADRDVGATSTVGSDRNVSACTITL